MFFNPYILSSVVLSSVTSNYLFDAGRDRKNEIFYKEKESEFKSKTKEVLESVGQIYKKDVYITY